MSDNLEIISKATVHVGLGYPSGEQLDLATREVSYKLQKLHELNAATAVSIEWTLVAVAKASRQSAVGGWPSA